MLSHFFYCLKQHKIPVSIGEYLDLINALKHNLAFANIDDFYALSRSVLVKDEKHFDKFDRAFSAFYQGLDSMDTLLDGIIPDDWLRSEFLKQLSDEEKAAIESLGSLEKLLEEFKKRIEQQRDRHQGGSKWIGTGGTSPFGNSGYNPEGIRVGGKSQNKSAVKVWDRREFQNLDDSLELGTRNFKMALRRLRKFARTGAAEELDIDQTIKNTARNSGWLDIEMRPERRNAVKVLLLFDVGGSMDPFVTICEQLFSAAKTEFKQMKYFYFHNFIYDFLWKSNPRQPSDIVPTMDILRTYVRDYKIIFIGDASMSPYEVTSSGGSSEFFNREAGTLWMQRMMQHYDKLIWLNPEPEKYWQHTMSNKIIRELIAEKMYPLTVKGIEQGMKYLTT